MPTPDVHAPVDQAAARDAAAAIMAGPAAVAFTGAGISTASGIPDFRSAGGMWANVDPMSIASVQTLHANPQRFWQFYAERFTGLHGIEPNPAHRALADLQRRGRLAGVITQNVDGLHQAAGSSVVCELHGDLRALRCMRCEHKYTETDLETLTRDDDVPYCRHCEWDGNVVRPGVVLFGENLPSDAFTAAHRLLAGTDTLIVIGSSLVVRPAADMPEMVLRAGGTVILINGSNTPYDAPGFRHNGRIIRLRCDIVAAMQAIMNHVDAHERKPGSTE